MNPQTTFRNTNPTIRPKLDEAKFKFMKGKGLSDSELDLLIQHYTSLKELLTLTKEPSYQLVLDDVSNNLNILNRFKWNREND